jgi:putative ABC transport system substrate-binding protein
MAMRRREFIAGLGSAAAWPLVARAQQPDRVRRIGVLMGWADAGRLHNDFAAFVERLAQLGWIGGRNVQIEQRWTDADADRARVMGKELIALQPDVIFAGTTPVTTALSRETRDIPIVFVFVSDPVGVGLAATLARPGGNITGFINVEASMGGKWLELIKRIAPTIKRAAIMFNPATAPDRGNYSLASFEKAARALAVEPLTLPVHSVADIEPAIDSLGGEQAGLVLDTDSFLANNVPTIIARTTRNKIPAIFSVADFAQQGGLLAYGPSPIDLFRRAAGHVDRILRGAKPADLPIKLDLVVNLKTARAFGLTVPDSLLVSATELVE